jgi:prepilin-type N-terminal cleavage/methylation domain-containing protein
MKLSKQQSLGAQGGFTLSEIMLSVAVGTVILAAAFTSTIALEKSFNAVDNYFGTHMQQIRIIDYLNRDVKRGLAVTTSNDLQSITVSVPSYLIQAGDTEALADPSTINTPRTPTIVYTTTGAQVNYTSTPATVVYAVNGNTITRSENGVVTTIASSTDQLVPQSTDVELSNTEYVNTNVTFLPLFTSGSATVERSGTMVCSTAYLRNKRRG